jgi:hypothetical protein
VSDESPPGAAREGAPGDIDHGSGDPGQAPEITTPREPRPMIERIGLGLIAALLALLFGVVSAASWSGGEPFLAVMAGVGCLMTLWVGALSLLRG